jgi:hypothetical protein
MTYKCRPMQVVVAIHASGVPTVELRSFDESYNMHSAVSHNGLCHCTHHFLEPLYTLPTLTNTITLNHSIAACKCMLAQLVTCNSHRRNRGLASELVALCMAKENAPSLGPDYTTTKNLHALGIELKRSMQNQMIDGTHHKANCRSCQGKHTQAAANTAQANGCPQH